MINQQQYVRINNVLALYTGCEVEEDGKGLMVHASTHALQTFLFAPPSAA